MSSEASAAKKIVIKPIIINNKKMLLQSATGSKLLTFPQMVPQYKEEVIYASSSCDFLKGESQEVLIINRLNLRSKTCRTIARCTIRGATVETTSDTVAKVIGQKNYETVLTALCSVFNEEAKVRGILALLSTSWRLRNVATQTESEIIRPKPGFRNTSSQTVDSRINMIMKGKQRKRVRRQPLTPYVVTEDMTKVKKCVINIDDVKKEKEDSKETQNLPDLKQVFEEDSNMSCGSVGNISLSSLPSVTGILDNPNSLLTEIDKVTDKTLNSTEITLRDGSTIMIPVKPEDIFHQATPEILKNVTHEERLKLIWHQAFIDFKMCIEQDEDGYYPLHIAVLNNDVDLVRRQCASLRARHESVDIPAAGLTALHMAIRQNVNLSCTSILLQHGADPLWCDQERRCSLHLAAESDSGQLRCLLAYCDAHVRSVLKNNADLWRAELESQTDEQLKRYLHRRISEMYDEQGYTPLMVAAEAAIPSHVSLLAARARALVDAAAPGCGATALYRVVAKACLHAKETNSVTTPEKYLKTIEVLVEHGADPSIENHAGSSVNTLLTEFNISALSMTIANKMTAMRHGPYSKDSINMMLYKHIDGRIGFKDINNVSTGKNDKKAGLHAVITVNLPTKALKDEKNVEVSEDSGQNAKSGEEDNSSSEIVDTSEVKGVGLNRISVTKGLKSDNVVMKSVLSHNWNEIKTNTLSDATKIPKHETDISLKSKGSVKNANGDNLKLQNDKYGKIVLKKVNLNVGQKGSSAMNVEGVKLNRKPANSLGNITFKRLNNGKMVAISHSSSKNMKFNLIKVESPIRLSKNGDDINVNDKTDLIKTEPPDEETTRSPKERKTDNVVIVENVPVSKEFAIPNILKPGTSKMAKPRDIVLSSTKVKTEIVHAAPKTVEKGEDVVKNFRKRKMTSE